MALPAAALANVYPCGRIDSSGIVTGPCPTPCSPTFSGCFRAQCLSADDNSARRDVRATSREGESVRAGGLLHLRSFCPIRCPTTAVTAAEAVGRRGCGGVANSGRAGGAIRYSGLYGGCRCIPGWFKCWHMDGQDDVRSPQCPHRTSTNWLDGHVRRKWPRASCNVANLSPQFMQTIANANRLGST